MHSDYDTMDAVSENSVSNQPHIDSFEPPTNVQPSKISDNLLPTDNQSSTALAPVTIDEQGYSVPPTNKSLIPDYASGEYGNDGFFDGDQR